MKRKVNTHFGTFRSHYTGYTSDTYDALKIKKVYLNDVYIFSSQLFYAFFLLILLFSYYKRRNSPTSVLEY